MVILCKGNVTRDEEGGGGGETFYIPLLWGKGERTQNRGGSLAELLGEERETMWNKKGGGGKKGGVRVTLRALTQLIPEKRTRAQKRIMEMKKLRERSGLCSGKKGKGKKVGGREVPFSLRTFAENPEWQKKG